MRAEDLTVWAGIWSLSVIGSYFFENTVTAKGYLTMLNDYFYQVSCDLSGNESIFLFTMVRQRIMLLMLEIDLPKTSQRSGLVVEMQLTGLLDLPISYQLTFS